MERNDFKIYAIDIDGTLTKTTGWDEISVLNAEPNKEMIHICNELFEKFHCVILYTARPHRLYETTVRWLEKYGVKYSALRFGKLAVDAYFDDKSYNPNCILCREHINNLSK